MQSKKILIADDDIKLLNALTVRLEAEGFEVMTTQDAYQALEFARRHKPDLLLLDINMPAGNGFSVQERILKIKDLSGTPIVYITGEEPGSIDRDAHKLGAFAIVHKPFKTQKLLETVRAAIAWGEDRAKTAAAA